MSKKPAKKQEEVVEEEAPVEVQAPAEPDMRDQLRASWALDDENYDERRRLIGEMMKLPDGPSHSLQSIRLDEATSQVALSKDSGMNVEQAKVFFSIMKNLMANLSDKSVSMPDAFITFKRTTMDNVDVVPTKPEEKKQGEEASASEKTEETAPPPEAKAPEKPGAKGKKSKEEEPPPEPEKKLEVVPEVPKETSLFTIMQVKHITDYVTWGIFGHYTLCQAVLSDSFQARKKPILKPVRIDTAIADGLSLADAVEIIKPDPAKAAAKSEDSLSAISKLVAERIRAAQEEMATKLLEHQQMLESRLEAITSKKGKK